MGFRKPEEKISQTATAEAAATDQAPPVGLEILADLGSCKKISARWNIVWRKLLGLPGIWARTCVAILAIGVFVTGIRQYFFERYAPTHQLKPNTVRQYDRSLRILCEACGSDPDIATLSAEQIATVVFALPQGARTRKRVRDTAVSVIRHAAKRGLRNPLGDVERVSCPPIIPVAWTRAEVRELVKTCQHLDGRGLYFDAFLRVGWDTGLRRSDIESIPQPNGSSVLVVRQQKTEVPILVSLREETIRSLRQLSDTEPLRWKKSERQFYYWWAKLCELANVSHGGPQKLRRSAATHVELEQPGSATTFLGHRSADLARRFYLDPRILGRSVFQPEEL